MRLLQFILPLLFVVFNTSENVEIKRKSLQVGDQIPNFSLIDNNGETFDTEDYIGKQPLVIFFYPKDNSPVCTSEVCSFRDSFAEFQELNAKIVGISSDHVISHDSFSKKHKLPYLLLSDHKKRVQKLFGVPKRFLGFSAGRVTYIANKKGKVIFIFKDHNEAQAHTEKALKALRDEKEKLQ